MTSGPVWLSDVKHSNHKNYQEPIWYWGTANKIAHFYLVKPSISEKPWGLRILTPVAPSLAWQMSILPDSCRYLGGSSAIP
jgi:hypothetical protein